MTTPTVEEIKAWSVDEVVNWAKTIINEKHANKLKEQKVKGSSLLIVTEEKLERWGIPGGPASDLFGALSEIKDKTKQGTSKLPFGYFLDNPINRKVYNPGGEFKFANRENVIEQMALSFLKNIHMSKLPGPQSSQNKPTLEICAQMYGSGKSYLGENFLPSLNSEYPQFVSIREVLSKAFKEELSQLLSCLYVVLDLRDINIDCNNGFTNLKVFLVRTLAKLLDDLGLIEKKNEFINKEKDKYPEETDFDTLILDFQNITGRLIFLHIDEIDAWNSDVAIKSQLERVTRFYELWNKVLDKTIRLGIPLYVSGRSSTLYSIGRGLYHNYNITSPSLCIQRVLDPLEIDHIKFILNIELKKHSLDGEDLNNIAQIIKKRTAGIPRFVDACIKIIKNDPNEYKKILELDKLVNYISYNYPIELQPYRSFPPKLKEYYIELARVSLLKLPIDLDASVNPATTKFWLSDDSVTITSRDLVKLLNLYIMSTNSKKMENSPENIDKMEIKSMNNSIVYIIFSEIQIAAIANDKNLENLSEYLKYKLPILSATYKILPYEFWQTREPFEQIVLQVIIHRLGLNSLSCANQTYGQVYQFLKKSYISKEKLIPHEQIMGTFPKFTASKTDKVENRQRIEPIKGRLELESVQKSSNFLQTKTIIPNDLKNCFNFKSNEEMVYGIGDKKFECAEVGVIYKSETKSNAAEIYVKGEDCYLGIQIKWGNTEFGLSDLKMELEKAKLTDETKFVFLIVVWKVKDELCSNNNIVKNDGIILAYQYDPGQNIQNYKIPENVQIIILTQRGLRYFIGDVNYDILEKRNWKLGETLLLEKPTNFSIEK